MVLLIENIQLKSYFVHFSNHSLDLALQKVTQNNSSMCNSFTLAKLVSNVFLELTKRKTIYKNLLIEPCHQSSKLNNRNQHLLDGLQELSV